MNRCCQTDQSWCVFTEQLWFLNTQDGDNLCVLDKLTVCFTAALVQTQRRAREQGVEPSGPTHTT